MSNSTSKVKEIYLDSDAVNTSATLSAAIGTGTTTYSSIDSLPVSSNNGDQALITSTNRLYIFSNGGWYNIALINTTPYWNTEANSSYELNTDGTSTTITLLAVDSEGLPITYIATADSDFNQIATVTKDSDNGRVFIVTPTDSENGTAIAGTGTVTFKASDGVNLATTLSTFSILFKIENSNYTSFLLKADSDGTDNQVDASTNAHTITENGNVTSTAFTPYHPGGYSTLFDDASSSHLIYSAGNEIGFGTGDFTVEFWANPDFSGATNLKVIDTRNASNWIVQLDDRTSPIFTWYNGASIFDYDISNTGNVWTHYAVAREGTSLRLFVNGVLVDTVTDSVNYTESSGDVYIGRRYNSTVDYFNGYIRDFRVVKGTAVYTSTFTPPTAPLTAISGTSLLTCHLPYIADSSTNNHTFTINGGTTTKRLGPYDYLSYEKADYGGSVYFDGNGDYLQLPSDAGFSFGTGDFTVEAWVYYPAISNTNGKMVIDSRPTSTNGSYWIFGANNSGLMGFTTMTTGGNNVRDTVARPNQWVHYAATRSGTSLRLFANGELVASTTDSSNISSSSPTIGKNAFSGNAADTWWLGYISDIRIVKGTAVYTSAFTRPTAPLTAITNTELLTCTNKNDIWEQADGGQVMTKVGNVTASNAQRNFLTSSAMYFDGNGDYIDFVKKDSYSFESGVDFTVEGWWYMNSIAGRPHFIGMGTGIDGTPAHYSDWNMYYNSSNQLTFYYYNGSTAIARTFAWTPVISTWYHIAVSRSGTDLKAFVNGTQIGSTITDSTNFSGAAGSRPLRIGRWQYGGGINAYLNGYAQDIRITKGLARYTANFTPPTVEFKG